MIPLKAYLRSAYLFLSIFAHFHANAASPVISARADQIEISLPLELQGQGIEVTVRLPYQTEEQTFTVWKGQASPSVTFNRIQEGYDLYYGRFNIVVANSRETLDANRWVTDTSLLGAATFAIPHPSNKKGLNSAVGLEDPIALGASHIVENISIDQLIDLESKNSPYQVTVDAKTVHFRASYVENLDTRLKAFHQAGIRTLGNLLKTIKWQGSRNDSPLTHPRSEINNPHALIGAFNLTNEEGYLYYRAALEFLASRYTREDAKFGILAGMIVGNEVQSHSVWYNMGPASIEEVTDNYHRAVRIAELAGKQAHSDWRVFVSLTHHWHAMATPGSPERGFSGRGFIDAFGKLSKKSGDFPWGVAWHPYPEDLFEPAFWLNFSATPYFDSPLVTMKNLEVLVAYLKQPHLRFGHQTREIVLSEQGFHGPAGAEPELKQAVALAYALELVQQIPEITAFHLHRHVDHPHEGGLMLGLRRHGPKGAEDIGPKKPSYSVFKAFGEKNWLEETQFALDYLDRDSWEKLYPGPESVGLAQPNSNESGIIDLYRLFVDANVANALDAKSASFLKSAGWLAPSIFVHPKDGVPASISWQIELPEIDENQSLALTFGTGIAHESSNGVTFSVQLDGREVYRQEKTDGTYTSHLVDLTGKAGSSRELSLIIAPGADIEYDWAHWVEPIIRIQN